MSFLVIYKNIFKKKNLLFGNIGKLRYHYKIKHIFKFMASLNFRSSLLLNLIKQ